MSVPQVPVAVQTARPEHPITSHPRRRVQGGVAIAIACLIAALIVGGTLAVILLVRDTAPPDPEKPWTRSQKVPEYNPFLANRASGRKAQPPPPEEEPDVLLAKAARTIYQTAAPASPDATNRIDELVFGKLKEKGITPAALCSDGVFLRRVYMDVIGTLPTASESRAFLDDRAANKRARLIDQLLEREEFADYWAMKWSDILRVKSEFPINLWPNAVQAYHRWIRTSLRENLPYDRFARALLTSSGSNFRVPAVNFYRAVQKKDAKNIAHAVALTFMGVRPEGWPKERWDGMATFFAQVGYKSTSEWKEEIVFLDPQKPLLSSAGVFPDGAAAALSPDQDPREVFADWLITPKNPWFTRNIVNRVWSWLVGRGIIHEPDDIRTDNPPSHPELLATLEQALVEARYDLKQIYRLILNSRTYQLSSIPASKHPEAAALFASYPIRRLEAEVLIDAICQVTGTTERYYSPIPEPFTYIPEGHRSISLADASITSAFLDMFGRPPRDTGLEAERNNNLTAGQRLHLLNSAHIMQKIEQGPGLAALADSAGKPDEKVRELYLTILSRYPAQDEMDAVMSHIQPGGGGKKALLDIAWALMNTAEFLCRH